jgi:hypothetical protein
MPLMARKRTLSIAVLLAALTVLVGMQTGAVIAKNGNQTPKILEWQTMVGVPQALTGTQAPIRGISGGGLPWTLTSGRGELSTTGHLELSVEGLVLAGTLSNPIAAFRATVSCLAADGSVQNVQQPPSRPRLAWPARVAGTRRSRPMWFCRSPASRRSSS